MWICLNNSFVSIVQHPGDASMTMIRGRRKEDVLNFIGGYAEYEITQTDYRDYRFRAYVKKEDVAKMLVACVDKITYGNFKDSVRDIDLKYHCSEVWASGVRNLDPDWINRQNFSV